MTKISNQYSLTNVLFADAVNGRVGIGNTTSPSRLLEVASGGDLGYIRVSGNRGNADAVHVGSIEFYNSNSSILVGEVKGITGTGGTQSASGQLAFYTNNAGTYAERMRITSSGNVGIGTSSPSYALTVSAATGTNVTPQINAVNTTLNGYGILRLTGNSRGGIIDFYDNSAAQASITGQGGAFYVYTNGDSSGSPKLTVNTGGKIGISANTADYTLSMNNAASSAYGIYMKYSGYSPNSTNFEFMWCEDATNYKFVIWSNGSVVNRTGSYGTISDIKFKENIVDATPKLADLLNLKVRNFNLKGEDTKQIGFIAQEFEEVFPAMVDVSKEKDSDETYKSIKTSVLVPMLVKAIQELSAQVSEQQLQINELKALLNA